MFKLSPKSSFWAKVALSIPGAEKPTVIEVEFKHMSKDALKTYQSSLESKGDEEGLAEIVLNWKGVDADFTRENLSALLGNYPASAREMFDAFGKECFGAKVKN
jgi:hypothetical protein